MLSRIHPEWRAVTWLVIVPLCVALLLLGGIAWATPSVPATPSGALSVSQVRYGGGVPRADRHDQAVRHAHAVHRAHLRHAAEVIHATVDVGYRVSICEEGGDWSYSGSTFDGGIGFLHATWIEFKRSPDPAWMHSASPYEQSRALFALVRHYGIAMPDQAGCTGGY